MSSTNAPPPPTDVEMEDASAPSSPFSRGLQLVVAVCNNGGIGYKGTLPWTIPTDMKHFRTLTSAVRDPTKRNAVVMGRRTWETIPLKYRPLKDRLNVVLTRNPNHDVTLGVIRATSLEEALEILSRQPYGEAVENVFIIGGGEVFSQALSYKDCWALHITRIEADYECDTFWNAELEPEFQLYSATAPILDPASSKRCAFMVYTRRGEHERKLPAATAAKHEEYQVLKLIYLGRVPWRLVLRLCGRDYQIGRSEGRSHWNRDGFEFWSSDAIQPASHIPSPYHKESLLERSTASEGSLKELSVRLGVVEELLWFISGSTNAGDLQKKGIRIWDGHGTCHITRISRAALGNASREFLDRVGLTHREEGDLGPVYGFQWRHFGAHYTDMHADYTGKGIDQLAEVVKKLREDPTNRRIVLSAWNPTDLKQMALPPCHMFCQFYVAHGELSCQMYQRSCDMGLGVPFNIASYALLTCLLAQVTGLKRGDFIHTLGDAHVYLNHINPLKRQLMNKPRPFPVLEIDATVQEVDDFEGRHIRLHDYQPHDTISMKLAV